ncbi:MAG: hypothetical protein J3Q66DRAFT_345725 [Benniella sp.]|nr:MAG: hypothetical protein J3Q66DRAFT_345725 [Benniella sp.]
MYPHAHVASRLSALTGYMALASLFEWHYITLGARTHTLHLTKTMCRCARPCCILPRLTINSHLGKVESGLHKDIVY